MRAILCAACITLLCVWPAGCSRNPAPAATAYAAEREKAFANWKKDELEGTTPLGVIWECALCPKLRAHAPGGIWAGSREEDPGRQSNEQELSSVKIPGYYAIGTYEVTRGEFNAFVTATGRTMTGGCRSDSRTPGTREMDSESSFGNPGFAQNDDHPAVCVSWQDAHEYVAWLNQQTSGGYRLPSEAEWHASAFGGGYELFTWGEAAAPACIYANVLDASATVRPMQKALACSDGASFTAPVGQYLPSSGWMFDGIGNAAEWTDTCDAADAIESATCRRAVVKGGSWRSSAPQLRLAARSLVEIGERDNSLGIRVAKTLGDPDAALDNARAYIQRGRMFLSVADSPRALAEFERAVELEPRNPHSLASRGWGYYRVEKNTEAGKDFTAALELDPSNAEAIAGLGTLAIHQGNQAEAVRQLDKAISLSPQFAMAISIRATAHALGENFEQALSDSELALQLQPTDIEMLRLRVSLRAMRGEWSLAIDEVDRLARAFPTMESAQRFAAFWYSRLMQDEDAVFAATRALRTSPGSEGFVLRASVRPWMDIAARRADIDAALRMDPKFPQALQALAELESRVGNYDAAIDVFTEVLQQQMPDDLRVGTLIDRGIQYIQIGDSAAARKDFDAALGPTPSASTHNNLCWQLALAEVALRRALDSCNRALAIEPQSASYLDSKGMVLLRLGQWEKSIETYDEAIRLRPTEAFSLYGRGVARQSRCKCEGGITDLGSALRLNPGIQRRFEQMGISPLYPPPTEPLKRTQASPLD